MTILAVVALAGPRPTPAVELEPDAILGPTIENLDNRQQVLDALASMIQARGWKCDTISAARKLVLSRGFKINCNRFDYQYLIKDRGGQWTMTLD